MLSPGGAAAVAVVIQLSAEVSARYAFRIPVPVIAAQKRFSVAAVRGYFRACKAQKALFQTVPFLFIDIDAFKVSVDQVPDPVPLEQCARDKQRILQVYLVLLIIAVVRELGVTGNAQVSDSIRAVLYFDTPDFVLLVQRNVIERLRMDSGVVRQDFRVAGAVAAFALVLVQRFPHGLPGGRPVIGGLVVPDIDVTPRSVSVVEHIAQDPAIGAGAHEAVAARVARDQGAVFGRAQIVGPGSRGVRTCDHIFSVFIVKIAVFHSSPPVRCIGDTGQR